MKINKGLLLPAVALLSATSLAVIASNNVAKFIKVIPEENSYFLRMDAGHNVFSIDNSTEIFDEDEYLDGYQMPVKNDNGYDISFFFDDYFEESEDGGFGLFENCFELHNLEAINGIKSITIKYANIRVCEGDYNPCLDQNVELPPECVTEEQKKNFYCNYIVTARPDWFDEDYTVEDWWDDFLEQEGYMLTADGHYPDGIYSINTDIRWGWELEDLEDDSLPYYTKNSFNNELTFDFFGTRPNYFSIGSEYLGDALDGDKHLAIESIIVEYTCNEGEKPSGYNNYDFTYIYHDDLNISDEYDDYLLGKYVEIRKVKDSETIETLIVPDAIDSYPVCSIGDRAFFGCPNLSLVQLSSNVKNLSFNCFANCSQIESIVLPEGLKVIHESAFRSTNLSTITLPESLEMIWSCFENTDITSLHFPKNVSFIYDDIVSEMIGITNLSVDHENPYYTDLDGSNLVLKICHDDDESIYYSVVAYHKNSIFKPGYRYLFESYNNVASSTTGIFDLYNITATVRAWSLRLLANDTFVFGPNVSIEPDALNSSGSVHYVYLDKNTQLLDTDGDRTDNIYYFDNYSRSSYDPLTIFINCDESDISQEKYNKIAGYHYECDGTSEIRYHRIVYLGNSATGLPEGYREL